jgi:hypothetical protein
MKYLIILVVIFNFSFTSLFADSKDSSSDSTAIIETALNYGEGFYSGDAARMEKALHPDFNKVTPVKMLPTGNTFLYYSTFSGLVEMSRAGVGILDESKRKINVTVYKIYDNIAFAKLMSSQFNDYLEMVKIDGQWKIINVLWTNGPDSPNKTEIKDFNPENEKDAIKQTVSDLFEGVYTGNPALIDKVVHPEYNNVTLSSLKSSGKSFLSKEGYSLMREIAQAKINLLEKEKWNLQINILDIMDGLTAVEVITPNSINLLQAAKMDGVWKIINSLRKPLKS